MQITGHDKEKEYFAKVLANGRLSHAYLFKGRSGIGKRSFALSLAQQLLGDNDKVRAQIAALSHPDLFVLSSDTLLGVKEIAPLYDFLANKSLIADIKICIIDNAELLTKEAQNKLLKATEEVDDCLIIFISANNLALLPALNSRLISIDFSPLTSAEMQSLIASKNLELDDDLLHLASGSIGEYQRLLDDNYQAQVKALNKFLVSLYQKGKLGDSSILMDFKAETARLFFDFRRLLLSAYKNGELHLRQLKQISTAIETTELALVRGQNYNLVIEALVFKIEEAKCS